MDNLELILEGSVCQMCFELMESPVGHPENCSNCRQILRRKGKAVLSSGRAMKKAKKYIETKAQGIHTHAIIQTLSNKFNYSYVNIVPKLNRRLEPIGFRVKEVNDNRYIIEKLIN